MAQLVAQQGPALDSLARELGFDLCTSELPAPNRAAAEKHLRYEKRLSALAARELGLGVPQSSNVALDEATMRRRCALPDTANTTVQELVDKLRLLAGYHKNVFSDVSMFWITVPALAADARAKSVLSTPLVEVVWLDPMLKFCAARQPGPGSPEQRAQVRALLCRFGWSELKDALSLVLDTLQWDTVEVLHFAVQLLRRNYDQLWQPMAQQLEAEFGAAAVLPLRKMLDPELTLFVAVAAPEHPTEVKSKMKRIK